MPGAVQKKGRRFEGGREGMAQHAQGAVPFVLGEKIAASEKPNRGVLGKKRRNSRKSSMVKSEKEASTATRGNQGQSTGGNGERKTNVVPEGYLEVRIS